MDSVAGIFQSERDMTTILIAVKRILKGIKKQYEKWLHKKRCRAIWGQKFDGYCKLTSGVLEGRIELQSHNLDKPQKHMEE